MRPFTTLAVAITLATAGPALAGEPHEHGHGRAAEHHQAVKDRVTPTSTMRQLVVRQRVTEEVERAVEHRAAETGSNADAARREEASEKAAAANIPLGDIIRNPTPRITQETAIEDFQAVKDASVSMISTFRQPVVKERVTEEVERAVELEVERAIEHHDVARAVEHKATDAGANPGAVSETKQ